MKRLLSLLSLFVFSLSVWGQVFTVDTYKSLGETRSIGAELKKKKNDFKIERIFIDCGGSYISLSPKWIPALIKSLSDLKDKFEEWKKIAIQNNVENFRKEMNINFPTLTLWDESYIKSPKMSYSYNGNGYYIVGFGSPVSLLFNSASQIESLITALDTDKILSKLIELSEEEENKPSGQNIDDLFQ